MVSKKITIKTIAEIAGVSVGTASEALNDSSRVNAKTKAMVKKVARQYDYRPNSQARALLTKRCNTIGFVMDSYQNYMNYGGSTQMLLGAMDAGARHNYNIMVTVTPTNLNIIDWGLDLYYSKKVDGLLFYGVRPDNNCIELLAKKQVPYIILSGSLYDSRIVTVTVDTRCASHALTNYLIGKGHRKIAHLSGSDISYGGKDRRQGYLDALLEHSIEVDEDLIVAGSYSVESGCNGFARLIGEHPDCTAVTCGSNEIALGVCKYLRERGKQEGRDFDVVGCNSARSMEEYATFLPNLTSTYSDYNDLGAIATDALIRWIQQGELKEKIIVLDWKFIKGDSA